MIPKIIHYFWFGSKQKPEVFQKCFNSWKKFASDFEIKEWNYDNFEFKDNKFFKEAYENKKYAFCCDVARILVLQKYGGVYLDVDVELVKPIDNLLKYDFFGGRDERNMFNTGEGFGCIPNHPYLNTMLLQYEKFILDGGATDEVPCPTKNEKSISDLGFSKKTDVEIIENNIMLPKEYMCPICFEKNDNYFCEKTYSIHHYSGSWRTRRAIINFKLKKGEKLTLLEKIIYFLQRVKQKLKI